MKKLLTTLLAIAFAATSCAPSSQTPEEKALQKERVKQLIHPIYSPW